MKFSSSVNAVIDQHLAELQKPGVISIRPGYEATGGWLTKKKAIVVTVEQKRDDLPAQDRLPEIVGGFPVDVRQAGPLHRTRASNARLYASVAASARPELERPTFPDERSVAGQLLTPVAEQVAALRARPKKTEIPYTPPTGGNLNAIEEPMTLICHASPDAGWPTLKTFLEGTAVSLTVGMYDFTSAHILATVQQSLAAKTLKLVLDHPAPNPSRDQTDEETVDDLRQALGDGFASAWALERQDPLVATWIYPSAYHIKVAVRDHSAFWLSSGNWNNSNQPDIDPLANPAGASSIARKSDRDWHVIVEHAGLAATFEAYLLNDLSVAAEHQQAADASAATAALAGLAEQDQAAVARLPQHYFPPQTVTGSIQVQPLLTPDNYCEKIMPLIQSAKRSFYMQTQYIHPSEDNENLTRLLAALSQLIAGGLDVRIILSQYETLDWLELLQDAGIDPTHVRIQTGVHNKGMIVDSKTAVVSSQNWSGAGVTSNRDAGLIIYSQEAAEYWEQIFIHDWTKMAVQHAAD